MTDKKEQEIRLSWPDLSSEARKRQRDEIEYMLERERQVKEAAKARTRSVCFRRAKEQKRQAKTSAIVSVGCGVIAVLGITAFVNGGGAAMPGAAAVMALGAAAAGTAAFKAVSDVLEARQWEDRACELC